MDGYLTGNLIVIIKRYMVVVWVISKVYYYFNLDFLGNFILWLFFFLYRVIYEFIDCML